jgi:hypothetical protein
VSDSGTAVLHLEAHHARTSTVHLDHKAPVRRGIPSRPFDLGRDRVVVASRAPAEERLNVFMVQELDEEVEIVQTGPPYGDHHRCAHRRRN